MGDRTAVTALSLTCRRSGRAGTQAGRAGAGSCHPQGGTRPPLGHGPRPARVLSPILHCFPQRGAISPSLADTPHAPRKESSGFRPSSEGTGSEDGKSLLHPFPPFQHTAARCSCLGAGCSSRALPEGRALVAHDNRLGPWSPERARGALRPALLHGPPPRSCTSRRRGRKHGLGLEHPVGPRQSPSWGTGRRRRLAEGGPAGLADVLQ